MVYQENTTKQHNHVSHDIWAKVTEREVILAFGNHPADDCSRF